MKSDHKALEMIQLKALSNVPHKLQRMLLQLQKYDMTIKYKPGDEMLLAFSRYPARRCLETRQSEIQYRLSSTR